MTNSQLFKLAHAMTKQVIQTGDNYQMTFGLCLKAIKADQSKNADNLKADLRRAQYNSNALAERKTNNKFIVSLCQCTDDDSSELFILMLADSEQNACLKVLKQYCPTSANNTNSIKIIDNEMHYYDRLSSIEYTLSVISNAK